MKVKNKLFIFFLLYIFSFIYSFFFSTLYNDEIWNFGFAYNIASGMVPYRDFNMVVTPLYNFLAALFVACGGKYLYSLHLFNSFIFAGLLYFCYKKLGGKGLILVPFILLNCYPSYNMLCMFLMFIIINIVDKEFKGSDFFHGLLVGLMFLTKQTIGVCLLVPLFYFSKNKKHSLVGFSSVVIIFFMYLIFNNALYEFLDYCVLGLFDFGNSNSILLFLPLEIIICLFILYRLFKVKFQDKSLFYLLMYQIVTIPIVDDYHFMVGIIPCLYYFLSIINIEKYKIKYYFIMSLTFFISWNFRVHEFNNINFNSDSSSYLYMRNVPEYVVLDDITRYIEEAESVYDHIYIFSRNAYYIKLNTSYKLDKYDLINNGNMGYNGSYKYIEEIDNYCNKKSCLFILYKYEFNNEITQTNMDFVNYVIDNYLLKEEIGWFDIYSNGGDNE